MPVTEFHVKLDAAQDEISGNAAVKSLDLTGCTSVQKTPVNDQTKEGYRVTWVHDGVAYEAQVVWAKKKAVIGSGPVKAQS